MDKSAFEGLENRKLSVGITKLKKDGTPETYVGFLEKIGMDYIVLDYGKIHNGMDKLSKIILALDIIKSVWVYKNNGG